ncbi:hypothetical protein OIU77_022894 [Salix suchowensis]|uniref:Uncharacterized protein n=1 Tax=Salix suchowensis TaxID=1278906 RepID=A0ABQ9C1Y9_9ROSI|nr:hypothetical protein OIU77_022894 [Salix suchowensis]
MSIHPKSIIDNTAFPHVFLNLIFRRFTISWYTSSSGILILSADIILTDPWFPLFSQLLKTFPNSTQCMKSKLIFTDFCLLFYPCYQEIILLSISLCSNCELWQGRFQRERRD